MIEFVSILSLEIMTTMHTYDYVLFLARVDHSKTVLNCCDDMINFRTIYLILPDITLVSVIVGQALINVLSQQLS